MVSFQPEEPQAGPRDVDFGVHGADSILVGTRHYTIYKPFLVIEAKRLPAPIRDREREYVTGTDRRSGGPTGGIQRFKLGLHGGDVETAAMVGYIESGLPDHWLRVINGWIQELAAMPPMDDCPWNISEILYTGQADVARGVSTFASVHPRSASCITGAISLQHIWVVMDSTDSD